MLVDVYFYRILWLATQIMKYQYTFCTDFKMNVLLCVFILSRDSISYSECRSNKRMIST